MAKISLGVLASGRGSNLQSICDACTAGDLPAEVKVVISDQPEAYALERARQEGIAAHYVNMKDYANKAAYEAVLVEFLQGQGVDLVCLAGYMRLVGSTILQAYPQKIMNIHPSLLPSFPGLNAHQQALDCGVKISGCTVHFVDAGMDTGPIILQGAVPVLDDDDEDSLSTRILQAEHRLYPQAIKLFAQGKLIVQNNKVTVR